MRPPARRRHASIRASRWGLVRDTGTIVGGALLALIGAQLLSGGIPVGSEGPGSAAPDETAIAIGSEGIGPTLPPVATLGPVVNPSADFNATPTPVPFATLGPGTLTVYVQVTNDNGGNDVASDWLISISGAKPTPITFRGSASGSTIPIDPGKTFTITATAKTTRGYVETRSGECTGPIPKGTAARCFLAENDRPVALTVKVVVSGGTLTPGAVSVTVTGSNVDKRSFKGSATGIVVHMDSNHAWTVSTSAPPTGYVRTATSGCKSTTGAAEGASIGCTVTYTYTVTPTPAPVAAFTCTTGTAFSVSFANQSTGLQSSWSWDFGDGTSSTDQSPPAHTYLVAGDYLVTLVVTGPGGSDSVSKTCTAAL